MTRIMYAEGYYNHNIRFTNEGMLLESSHKIISAYITTDINIISSLDFKALIWEGSIL